MERSVIVTFFFISILWSNFWHTQNVRADAPHELTLREALDLAQAYSPEIRAAKSRENEAQSSIPIAKSYYLPKLEAQAIESTGFPGSSGYLGIGGIMGSPFRSGVGAGVVLTQTLYDFGRTSNRIESAESQMEVQKQETEITRYTLNQQVIQAYFTCTYNRSQTETWLRLEKDAEVVEHEVKRFVQTGQRSVVDRYLAETQSKEALTSAFDFQTRERESEKRLAILLGVQTKVSCPPLPTGEQFGLVAPHEKNPFIARAEADLKSVQSRLAEAKAENLPNFVAVGSAGYLEDTHLLDSGGMNYSVGVGISIPIFEGFRIQESVKQKAAEVEEKNSSLQASVLRLDDLNQQYDESILSSSTRLEYLAQELILGTDAFNLAKKRYFSFQGDLLDVRAALSNLTRVLLDENSTRAQYLQAKELKEVLNGAK